MCDVMGLMAHLRHRFAGVHVKDAVAFSPVVGILGMRQTGKTTLVEDLSNKQYATLDDDTNLLAASQSPQSFLASFKGLGAIDEW